jgi:homoserine kinase
LSVPLDAGGAADGPAGRANARVRVSATSANLGPGFDSLGLALDLHDEVEVRVTAAGGVRVRVIGEGAGEVPDGEDHLVVRALRHALKAVGADQPDGLELLCRNAIPHARGLGSSAAAVVAGVLAARCLLPEPSALDDDAALIVASDLEGHPDNAAAALLGGATVAWVDERRQRGVRLDPDGARALVAVPQQRLATHHARSVLPASVRHEDAARNAGRSALLVEALTRRPDLLLPATEDRLHQCQRAGAMPATVELVDALRARGLAAVVSGAGPTVLVLTSAEREAADADVLASLAPDGWRTQRLAVERGAAEASRG